MEDVNSSSSRLSLFLENQRFFISNDSKGGSRAFQIITIAVSPISKCNGFSKPEIPNYGEHRDEHLS